MLFADSSMREFKDFHGDSFLNPGFPVPDDLTEEEYALAGYCDDTVELSAGQCFSGIFVAPNMIQGTFEN